MSSHLFTGIDKVEVLQPSQFISVMLNQLITGTDLWPRQPIRVMLCQLFKGNTYSRRNKFLPLTVSPPVRREVNIFIRGVSPEGVKFLHSYIFQINGFENI